MSHKATKTFQALGTFALLSWRLEPTRVQTAHFFKS